METANLGKTDEHNSIESQAFLAWVETANLGKSGDQGVIESTVPWPGWMETGSLGESGDQGIIEPARSCGSDGNGI